MGPFDRFVYHEIQFVQRNVRLCCSYHAIRWEPCGYDVPLYEHVIHWNDVIHAMDFFQCGVFSLYATGLNACFLALICLAVWSRTGVSAAQFQTWLLAHRCPTNKCLNRCCRCPKYPTRHRRTSLCYQMLASNDLFHYCQVLPKILIESQAI